MEPPQVDGYVVDRLIGYGPTGQVWRAREQRSGEWVALKRLQPQAEPSTLAAALGRLQREAVVFAGLDSPHLVPVRAILEASAAVVLISDYIAGDSVETLLARRDGLSPGEVVTLLAPLAQGLAQLHEAGLVHGGVAASNVLLGPEGRPMLTDIGVALALGASSADQADDVRALAELGLGAIGASDGPLFALLGSVVSRSPDRMPSAEQLAAAVLATGSAAPIRSTTSRRSPLGSGASLIPSAPTVSTPTLSTPIDRPTPPRRPAASSDRGPRLPVGRPQPAQDTPRPRRISRATVLIGLVAVVLVGIVATIVRTRVDDASGAINSRNASTPPASTPAATTPSPTATSPTARATHGSRFEGAGGVVNTRPTGWRSTIQTLENKRVHAFAAVDSAQLNDVYAHSAPGLAADQRTIDSLHSRGLRPVGFAATVLVAKPLQTKPTEVTLRVTDRLSSYSLVDVDGRVVQAQQARPEQTYLMTLRDSSAGWRVEEIAPIGQSIDASAASSSG